MECLSALHDGLLEREGDYLRVLKVHQAENWSQASRGASWDLGLLLTAFKYWILGGERTFSAGELPIWPPLGFCRLLLRQDRAQKDGVPKPPLQTSGADPVCRAGPCGRSAHLSHPPPEEEAAEGRDAVRSLLLPRWRPRAQTHDPTKASGARTGPSEPWSRLQPPSQEGILHV